MVTEQRPSGVTKPHRSAGTTCEWCGVRLPITAGPGRLPRFCKPSHRQRAYERRKTLQAMEAKR